MPASNQHPHQRSDHDETLDRRPGEDGQRGYGGTIAFPAIKRSTSGKRMPNMALREKDIGPLIAFINAERVADRR